jgi:hypothetical protein
VHTIWSVYISAGLFDLSCCLELYLFPLPVSISSLNSFRHTSPHTPNTTRGTASSRVRFLLFERPSPSCVVWFRTPCRSRRRFRSLCCHRAADSCCVLPVHARMVKFRPYVASLKIQGENTGYTVIYFWSALLIHAAVVQGAADCLLALGHSPADENQPGVGLCPLRYIHPVRHAHNISIYT